MSFDKRQRVVNEFRNSDSVRILIISAVGNTGLNLACADFLIFVDQPWSGQDVDQGRGRVCRYPQKKEVWILHILALNTSDVIMSTMALGKKDMLDAFVSAHGGQGIFITIKCF
jgi:SNF2 family DNA or RNA helicase